MSSRVWKLGKGMGDFLSSVTNTIWGGDPVIVVREQSKGYTAEWDTVCRDYSRFEIHYTKDTANLGYSTKGIHLAWDRVFRGYNRPGIRYTQDAGGLAYSIQMTLQAWDIVFLDSEKKVFNSCRLLQSRKPCYFRLLLERAMQSARLLSKTSGCDC